MHRWFALGVALLAVTSGTGCPEYYGKEGYFDDAMRKDMEEKVDERQRELGKPVPCRDGKRLVQECKGSGTSETCHWDCK
jgi:hypothetical protein